MVWAVTRRPHRGGPGFAQGQSICDGQSGIGTGFSPSYLAFLCQYYSVVALDINISSSG
jgi:hypothetical protein